MHLKEPLLSLHKVRHIDRMNLFHLGAEPFAVFVPRPQKVLFVSPVNDCGFDRRSFMYSQLIDSQVAVRDCPGKYSARKIGLTDLALPGAQQVADSAHALSSPDRLSILPQFVYLETGRAHEV